jgi:hypothetical protein
MAAVGVPALMICALAWPMLFTHAELSGDWGTHLWYMWNQSMAIRSNHQPSLFLNYSHSVFYPEYAFYGGTLYAVVGTLSLLFGDAPVETYVAAYLGCFAAAYGGWYWMARMAGLRDWRARAPGLIFITSGYYLTLIYARGDWPEFTGVSMIPLLMASGMSVLRADRLRIWPALALAGSGVLFFGSHTLTVVWGSTVIALTGVAVVVCVPGVRRWLRPRCVLRVACLLIPALLVSAWFLLPAVAYEAHTDIASRYLFWRLVLRSDMYMVSAQNLFSLSRASFIEAGCDFALALPILAMAWSLAGILVVWRSGARGAWTRVLLVCAGLTVLTIVVMTHAGLMLALPRPYAILQFAYRLESYVILAVCGAVVAGLAAAKSGTRSVRIWTWVLVPILIVSGAGAIQQTKYNVLKGNRSSILKPHSGPGPREEGLNDYSDADLPVLVDPSGRPPEVDFPISDARGDRVSATVHLHPGELFYTNLGGGPELVHVAGAKIVGRGPEDNDVLEVDSSAGSSKDVATGGRGTAPTEIVAVSPRDGLPIVLGRILSLAAAIFLVVELLVIAVRGMRAAKDEPVARAR